MQEHIKTFFESRKKDLDDYIPCELCRIYPVQEIHHISSSFRGKRKNNDGGELIGLCLSCHRRVHARNNFRTRCELRELVKSKLDNL